MRTSVQFISERQQHTHIGVWASIIYSTEIVSGQRRYEIFLIPQCVYVCACVRACVCVCVTYPRTNFSLHWLGLFWECRSHVHLGASVHNLCQTTNCLHLFQSSMFHHVTNTLLARDYHCLSSLLKVLTKSQSCGIRTKIVLVEFLQGLWE